jgi:hypothetical protein
MKPFTKIAAVIFFIIAIVHILRLMFHWEVTVNGLTVPQWVSIPGFLIPAILSVTLWHEVKK